MAEQREVEFAQAPLAVRILGRADIIELADFAEKLKIDLTVVGPELPLTIGIVDEFQKRGGTKIKLNNYDLGRSFSISLSARL